jgi:glycosyltransferase involved in cell wall biosynthesis
MRILIHSQYFPPEIGAPQSRLSELAIELEKMGFCVSVLTAFPNYPTGKIFPGYSGFFRNEKSGRIKIFRSFIFPSQSAGLIPRLFNYFSFTISSFLYGLFLPKFDIILTESPPLFLGLSGLLLSKIKRAKWVFNVADLWPASVAELGLIKKNSTLFKVSEKLESALYHHADVVTGQSKSILININERFPEIKTYHFSNGVDPERFQPSLATRQSKIKIMYAGLHGLAQGLDQIVKAAIALQENNLYEFIFIGDGPEKKGLLNLVKQSGIKNVTFLDPIPSSQIPATLSSADILLVPLKIHLTGAVPSKLYEGMAAGKPIILIAGSEAAGILQDAGCGISVKPGDIDGLVSAILQLAGNDKERNRLGSNGRKAAIEKYNRHKIAQEFANFLLTLG